MDKWISVVSDADVQQLLDLFGGFHDSCICYAQIWSGHFVNADLSMSTGSGLDTCAKFLVQRQFKAPSCIELQFEQVTRINIAPTPENYNSVIYEASLKIQSEGITWALDPSGSMDASEDTWVTAKILKYRRADELIGPSKKQLS